MIQAAQDLVSEVAKAYANGAWWAGYPLHLTLFSLPPAMTMGFALIERYRIQANFLDLMRSIRSGSKINPRYLRQILYNGLWYGGVVLVWCAGGVALFAYGTALFEAEHKHGANPSWNRTYLTMCWGVAYMCLGAGVPFWVWAEDSNDND